MSQSRKHDRVVREPLQVYLTGQERTLLDRVALHTGVSRAEVLRRGLQQISREALGAPHPGLAFLDEMRAGWPADIPADVAERHDEYLAKAYADRPKKKRR